MLAADGLAVPHLLPVEVASILHRSLRAGAISADTATMAHRDLPGFRIELFPYEPFAERVWDLRDNVTTYDAWYVALAESLGTPLATLDRRLSRASGPRCPFLTPS
ncbi:MAG: Toxin 1, domain [Acidimicrobiales bacterium]|nr:Toxin 1, domain [Acidimicrobiales bacterium]